MNAPQDQAARSASDPPSARHHLQYWSIEQVASEIEKDDEEPWRHTAGAQLGRVSPGDVVWVVTFGARRPYLIARIPADQVVDDDAAARLLGSASLWEARWHVIAEERHAEPPSMVEFADLVPDLRFAGPSDRIPAAFDHQHFRTLRTLAPDSVPLFEARWAERDDWLVDSRRAADAILARILPTAERRTWFLGWFAHAVETAHELAPDKWSVLMMPDRARLYVGWTIVRTLYEDRIWMYLNRDILSAADEAILSAEPGWEWDDEADDSVNHYAGKWAGYLSDVKDEDAASMIIQGALHRRIASSAKRGGLRKSTKDGWASSLLEAVEAALGRPLPRPDWLDAEPSDAMPPLSDDRRDRG